MGFDLSGESRTTAKTAKLKRRIDIRVESDELALVDQMDFVLEWLECLEILEIFKVAVDFVRRNLRLN